MSLLCQELRSLFSEVTAAATAAVSESFLGDRKLPPGHRRHHRIALFTTVAISLDGVQELALAHLQVGHTDHTITPNYQPANHVAMMYWYCACSECTGVVLAL